MGSSFSSQRNDDARKSQRMFFISLSGPEVSTDPQFSFPKTFRQAEQLQQETSSKRNTEEVPPLLISFPRQEDEQQVDSVAIGLLSKLLIESSELEELYLQCSNVVPPKLCDAVSRNRSIRSLYVAFANFDEMIHADLMDSVRKNNTLKSLCIRGNANKMASSVVRLLHPNAQKSCSGPELLDFTLIHTARITDFNYHVKHGSIETKQLDQIIEAVVSSHGLRRFRILSNGGAVHYFNHHLATLLQSPSLESISLSEMKLCGESSSSSSSCDDGHHVYAALSSNRQLRELNLVSFSKFIQIREIAANLEREIEAALKESNATLTKLDTFNTMQVTERMKYWLDLNAHGRSQIRREEKMVDKLLPHILARVSENPNRLFGLLREAVYCVCTYSSKAQSPPRRAIATAARTTAAAKSDRDNDNKDSGV